MSYPLAKKTEREVVVKETGIALEMDTETAVCLVDILRNIAGSPRGSRRGLAQDLLGALNDAGVHGTYESDTSLVNKDFRGTIYFTDSEGK